MTDRRPLRMLLLACAMWGLSFPVIKALTMVQLHAVPEADGWLLTGATMVSRFAVAAALVALLLLRGDLRCSRKEWMQGLGLGFFGGLGMIFQVDGLSFTDASTSAFLTQGTVITIPIVKALAHRSLPGRRTVLCCLLATVGVAVLAQFDWHHMRLGRGEAETLIAALFFTGHILWVERPEYRGNDARRVSFVMFATVAAICAPMIAHAPAKAMASVASPSAMACLAVLIGPCTLGSFMWMNRWQPFVSATTAGLVYCMEPVFASVFALFLPGLASWLLGVSYGNESPSYPMLVGGGLILLANIFMQWPATRETADSALNEHGV